MNAREQRPGLNSPEDARDDVPLQVEVFPTQFIETADELTCRLREFLGSDSIAPDYSKQRAILYGPNPPPYTSDCVGLIRALSRGNQRA